MTINLNQEIAKTEKALAVLELIKQAKRNELMFEENIKDYQKFDFYNLLKWNKHNLDITRRAISRLELYYTKLKK